MDMTGDALWWLVTVLAVVCAVLAVMLLRKPRPAQAEADHRASGTDAVPSPPGAAKPAAVSPGAGSLANVLAPQPAAAAPQRNPVAALVAPPAVKPPTTLVVTRARRYELRDGAPEPVLMLERAAESVWEHAPVANCTPMQRDTLAAALAHATLLAPSAAPQEAELFSLKLRAGAALALARGEIAAAPGGMLRAQPAQSLDATRAAPLAAIVLALRCAPVYLGGLRSRVSSIQAEAAVLLKRPTPVDDRFKALLQDLTRYLREVEENHAGVIRKPVFVARVADFCVQAEAQWRAAIDTASALRHRLQSQLGHEDFDLRAASDWKALWLEYETRRRLARCTARMLACWHGLRLALGEAAPAASAVLRGAMETLRIAVEADAAMGRALQARALGLAAPLEKDAAQAALRELLQTAQAIDAGFAGEPELQLLLRLDALGRVADVRGPLAAD
jgi:hypothetical protein